ncbi:MAG: hypothetical protein U0792_05430 [Gemmataceae bacterium]
MADRDGRWRWWGAGEIPTAVRRRSAEVFDLLSLTLGPTDFETADAELTRFLARVTEPGGSCLGAAAEEVQAARLRTHAELAQAFDSLLRAMRADRFSVTHPVVAALAGRVLRAGTSTQSDLLLCNLLTRWREAEDRVGFEIDGRTFAWLASADEAVGSALQAVVKAAVPGRGQRFAAVSGLLWPRGSAAWGQRLRVRNPYLELAPTDRELALAVLPPSEPPIPLDRRDVAEAIRAALLADGFVAVTGSADAAQEVILRFAVEPLDTGTVLAYPRVRSATACGDTVTVTLELAEASP